MNPTHFASSRRHALLLIAAVLSLAPFAAIAQEAKPAPAPEKPRVLIISVDGLRPHLMLRAKTPNMHRLFEGDACSFWARTLPHAITLPSRVSMLTGVIPRTHEVGWNVDLPLKEPVYPTYPNITPERSVDGEPIIEAIEQAGDLMNAGGQAGRR